MIIYTLQVDQTKSNDIKLRKSNILKHRNLLMKFDLSLLSKYRTELMGMATMMILICHAKANGVIMPHIIEQISLFGGYGVEIFLLLSGIGLSYSLEKKTIYKDWLKKRYLRILLPYFMIALPWFVVSAIQHEEGINRILLDTTTLSFWLYGRGAWFIALLLPLYLTTPLIYKFSKTKWGKLFIIILCSALWFIATTMHWDGIINNIMFALVRIPCFIIGLLIAQLIKDQMRISVINIIITLSLSSVALYAINKHISWWLLIFPIIMAGCYIFEKLPLILPLFRFYGLISLESYVCNLALGDTLKKISILSNSNIKYLFIVVIGTLLAYTVNKLSSPIITKIN